MCVRKVIVDEHIYTYIYYIYKYTYLHATRPYARVEEVSRVYARLTCTPQLCLQLDPSALPSLPLSRRDHRPRFPRHAFRTAVSDNGKQLLLISVT